MPQPRYERAECNFHNEKNGVAPRVGQGSLKPFVARECRGNALTAHIPYLKKKMCYVRLQSFSSNPHMCNEGPDAVEPHYNEVATEIPCKYVRRYRQLNNAISFMLKNASGVPMTVQLKSVL